MTDTEQLAFCKLWIKALDGVDKSICAKVNALSGIFTGKFIGLDADGNVEILMTKDNRFRQ